MSSWSDTTCRACFADASKDFFEFHSECHFSPDNLTFHEVFNTCTHFQIAHDDGLPQRICASCSKELQIIFNFQHKVLQTNLKLKNLTSTNEHLVVQDDNLKKDPLENLTDENDSDSEIEQEFTLNINNNNKEGAPDVVPAKVFNNNDDNKFYKQHPSETTPERSSCDSDDKDNEFLESVETQIFPKGQFLCTICDKAYFTNIGLQTHMDIHKPKQKRHNSKEVSKLKKAAPTTTTTSGKPKILMGKVISNASDENHDDDKLHGEKLPNENKLGGIEKSVEKTRKPKKTFPCQVCGKQMISISKLRYHMVMHTGEKDYLCTMCPKAYSTIYALKHHMRAHTGERPYECKFCGDRFLRPTTLKSHMRRHTGERPYGCDKCGKRFIQHSSMATHIKLNHMDKTISCPYCDKKYARQTDLNTHLLSHSGEKPFACKMCPSRFTRQSNLNKHMNQQHQSITGGEDDEEDCLKVCTKRKCPEDTN